MKNTPRPRMIALLIPLLLLGGMGWIANRAVTQQHELRVLRQRLLERTTLSTANAPTPDPAPAEHPSPELLRARAEVAELVQQVARRTDSHTADREATNDSGTGESELDRLMKGRRPSEFPDFVSADQIQNRGFDTADHALESFWWHFAGPDRMGNDSTRLWWSPPTNPPTGFHYEIFLGMGVGGLTGYRVTRREEVSPGEVLFHLQREEGRRVVEEQARFIRDGHRWVRKPSVKLVPDQP